MDAQTLKRALWRFAMRLTPFPMASPRDVSYWQNFWRSRPADQLSPYATRTAKREWLAQRIIELKPATVLELGCNLGANLRALREADASLVLYGIDINDATLRLGREQLTAVDANAHLLQGSMADADRILPDGADVVLTSAAAMHIDDAMFALTKRAALAIAKKAIVHLEYHAWTPAELENGRAWRQTFLSDRWVRDYVAEYETEPRVSHVNCVRVPHAINPHSFIGRVAINDVTGLTVVGLTPC